MPPRKRKAAPAQADAEEAGSPRPSNDSDDQDDFGPDGAPRKSMPFYNVTYTTHRASPLHIGSEPLSPARLQTLSTWLRNTLVGDVVRGVQVGLGGGADDGSLGRAGVLESVEWRWVRWGDLLDTLDDDGQDHDREGSLDLGAEESSTGRQRTNPRRKNRKALCLELKYENAYFTASLLPSTYADAHPRAFAWGSTTTAITPDTPSTTSSQAFIHLPLLLLRMPAPLRAVVSDFLASTFDCRISPLHLGTRSLVHMWESWLTTSKIGQGGPKVTKDVVLTLGFHLERPDHSLAPAASASGHSAMQVDGQASQTPTDPPQQGLKSIDIILPASHVARFLRAGRKIQRGNLVDTQRQKQEAAEAQKRRRGPLPAPSIFASNPAAEASSATEEHRARLTQLRRKLAGGKTEEGWQWRSATLTTTDRAGEEEDDGDGVQQRKRKRQDEQPFIEAVASYLSAHLALDMFHPAVRISKIACGGFVAAESGRLKVFEPLSSSSSNSARRATEILVGDLADKAASGGVSRTAGAAVVGDVGEEEEEGDDSAAGGQQQQQGPWSRGAMRIAELAAAVAAAGEAS